MRSSSWAFAQVRKKVCGYIGVVQFSFEKTKNENWQEKLFHGLSKHGRKSEKNVKSVVIIHAFHLLLVEFPYTTGVVCPLKVPESGVLL